MAMATMFTCFPALPGELRTMIWAESLCGYAVIFLGHLWSDRCWFPFSVQRYGFNPLPIALSCREAAAVYHEQFPRRILLITPSLKLRVDADRTLFVAKGAQAISVFLSLQRLKKFHPIHLGFEVCDWDYNGLVSEGYVQDFISDEAAESRANTEDQPRIGALVKIRWPSVYRRAELAEHLIRLVWTTDSYNDGVLHGNNTRREYARVLQ